MPYIGIDFGTSNSVVANFQYGQAEVVPNHEGQKWTPSIVTLRRDGTLAFGQEAKENFDEQRSIRSIKRILGTPERVPLVGQNLRTEQIAVMLFSLLKKDAEQVLNESVHQGRRHHPGQLEGTGPPRHQAVRRRRRLAGADAHQRADGGGHLLRPERPGRSDGAGLRLRRRHPRRDDPAASITASSRKSPARASASSAATTSTPLLAKVLAERFQEKTGFDILNSPYKQQFMLAVERAKIDLSAEQTAVARKAELVPERHLSLEEEIDRGEFERIIMPLIVKSGTAIDEAMKLRGCGRATSTACCSSAARARFRSIRRYVAEKLAGKEPESFDRVDPMTCVAQGAAIVSAILQGAPGLDNYAYSVKLEHSLCANPVDQRTNRVFLDPIIKRGADIPCSFSKTYYPVADPADRVLISVYEGDIYDNPESPENVKLAEIPWEFKPPRPQRDGGLDVAFEYGDDGILTVQIHDPVRRPEEAFRHPAGRRGPDWTPSQLIKLKRINEELVNRTMELESTQEYKDAVEVLKKTEQDVIPRIENPEDRRELEDLCRQVRQAMGSGDRKKMEDATAHAQRSLAELRLFAVRQR